MTEEQIEEIELILNADFIKESHGQYRFEMSTVEDAQIIFDTNDELVLVKTECALGEVIAFNLEELQNITKVCEDVLGWY